MKQSGEGMDAIRDAAQDLLTEVLPFDRGDATFHEVCAGYTPGPNAGTTCTFLPHWLLWKLGVTKENRTTYPGSHTRPLLNRTDPERGTKLVPGSGIGTIYNSPAFVHAYRAVGPVKSRGPNALERGERPHCGDIIFVDEVDPTAPQWREHVFVFVKEIMGGPELVWRTGEAGARAPTAKGGTEATFHERRVTLTSASGAPLTPEANDAKVNRPPRAIVGWLDIGQLDYDPDVLGALLGTSAS